MEGCADGRARALNLQCAGRDVDDLGLPRGTALELKALLELLRAPVHTGAGAGAGGAGAPAPAPAPSPAPARPAPVQVCDAHTCRTYMSYIYACILLVVEPFSFSVEGNHIIK